MSWKGNAPPKGVLVTRGATVNPAGAELTFSVT